MEPIPQDWSFAKVFDGQDQGCGDMLLELRFFVDGLPGGTRVVVASRDRGSPSEIPAWCRMTRHRLLETRPPYYLVETRSNGQPKGE